ncbi:MAG: hypothetical protein GDA48_15690 [Hormoscilla sp. GM102CHS1]|nr:hypothetical protein [Hormoscilla sp. GM102CHS1]
MKQSESYFPSLGPTGSVCVLVLIAADANPLLPAKLPAANRAALAMTKLLVPNLSKA